MTRLSDIENVKTHLDLSLAVLRKGNNEGRIGAALVFSDGLRDIRKQWCQENGIDPVTGQPLQAETAEGVQP